MGSSLKSDAPHDSRTKDACRTDQVEELTSLFLGGAERDKLDPILDTCVAAYLNELDEDGQVDFKGKAKAFTRTHDFLASILPYSIPAWEKLSILLNLLIPKLPAPKEEDLANALAKVMLELLKDDTEVYKQFVENPSFNRFVKDMIFTLTVEER